MLQHWDCRAFKKAINNLLSEMGQIQTSTLDPSCCFRQGRSRTSCAPEKEKPSCSSITKCLNQADDTDQTKIKTAQRTTTKFLRRTKIQLSPPWLVSARSSPQCPSQCHCNGSTWSFPPPSSWAPVAPKPWGLRQTPHRAQHPRDLPATWVSLPQTHSHVLARLIFME